jgi:hypothetical protein
LALYKEKRAEWIADTDKNGMRSVWIEGEVTYDDVFGESYVSEFAFMTFAFCNDMESWIEMWGLQKRLYVPVVVRPHTKQGSQRKKLEQRD